MNAIFSFFSTLVTTLVLKPLDHILFFGTGVLYKSKETMVQEMAADWVKRSEAFSKEFGLAKHGHSSSSFAPVTVAVSAIADDDDISGGEWPDGEKFGAPCLFANSIDTDVGGRYYEHSISETDLPET
ncbi:MAG: hypothetical protein L6Q40_07505, partial [Azonexus sp.]|nr:hypothetical protein [Azonexus sp.]